jgi:hypothetical protein
MKTRDAILLGLAKIAPDFDMLGTDLISHFDVCQQLHNEGLKYNAVSEGLTAAIHGDSDQHAAEAVRKLRFAVREQGLLMLRASRLLSQLSVRCMAISEQLALVINED